MPSGLAALLDDVAMIAKLAASSVDDIGLAAGKASTKAAGVVIDDTAVTPQYVTGFTPDRELPIIWRIAKGSLFNKLVIILPIALLLSAFLPVAITPILMLGAAYLCFEGAEKVIEKFGGHEAEVEEQPVAQADPEFEKTMVSGAVRTDFILSAEIMVIALREVSVDYPDQIWLQAAALVVVGVAITIAVYGVVGLIVKMDDIGLNLAKRSLGMLRMLGTGLVKAMPKLFALLSTVGTAAMLWVGGQIIVHGFGLHPAEWLGLHQGALGWLADAAISGVIGLAIGGVIVVVHHRWAHHRS